MTRKGQLAAWISILNALFALCLFMNFLGKEWFLSLCESFVDKVDVINCSIRGCKSGVMVVLFLDQPCSLADFLIYLILLLRDLLVLMNWLGTKLRLL